MDDRKALLEAHRDDVSSHMYELARTLDVLDRKIDLYECGAYNAPMTVRCL